MAKKKRVRARIVKLDPGKRRLKKFWKSKLTIGVMSNVLTADVGILGFFRYLRKIELFDARVFFV